MRFVPVFMVGVCGLLVGCPFSAEDLAVNAGAPLGQGPGGEGGPGGPGGAGGAGGEPDINAMLPAFSQDEILAGPHFMVRGEVQGACPAAVRVDVLNGKPGQGGPPPAGGAPLPGQVAKDAAAGGPPPDGAPPEGGAGASPPAGPPPEGGAGAPLPDGPPPEGGPPPPEALRRPGRATSGGR